MSFFFPIPFCVGLFFLAINVWFCCKPHLGGPESLGHWKTTGSTLVLEKVERAGFKKVLFEGYLGGVKNIKVKSELERNGEKKEHGGLEEEGAFCCEQGT